MTIPFLEMHHSFAVIGAGGFLLYRATRRVNPAHLAKGTIVSIHTNANGEHSATIEYSDLERARRKTRIATDFYPSFGQEVQLILKPGATPDIHEERKPSAFILGLILLAAGLLMALIAATRTHI